MCSIKEFPLRVEELEITGGGYGYEPLLERIAHHTGAPTECIVTAEGTSMANHLAMAALLEPGDEVVIEEPTYGLLLDLAHYLGAERKADRAPLRKQFRDFAPGNGAGDYTGNTVGGSDQSPQSNWRVDFEGDAAGDRRAGAARRRATCWSMKSISKCSSMPPLPSAFSLGESFVVTSSLTKAYGLSGLRCGWILAAPELARRIWRLNDLFAATAAHPAERMSVTAFDHLAQFRERARGLLAPNRALLDAFLDSRRDLECFRPPVGTVVFPRLPRGEPEAFFKLLREKYETSVVPGEFFECPRHFRLGIGGDTASLRTGLERLSAALDEFGTQGLVTQLRLPRLSRRQRILFRLDRTLTRLLHLSGFVALNSMSF